MSEFDLIARIRARATRRDDVILGIGDDAALLQVPAGMLLVVATDTLNSGVHFPPGTAAVDIGWKALAVNLSDLAAMGAQPAWCTLSLSLPDADAAWLDAFLDGFLALANQHDVALVGGDTTRGPLSVCVTVHGLVEPGRVLLRDGARVDDDIWVTGTLGDAAAALSQWRQGLDVASELQSRLARPTPRIEFGHAIAGIAHAAIDISDGLLSDLGHVCRASAMGARIELAVLPASKALLAASDIATRHAFQANGGDDYELCFTAPAAAGPELESIAARTDSRITRIGRIAAGDGVQAVTSTGDVWTPRVSGYEHFPTSAGSVA